MLAAVLVSLRAGGYIAGWATGTLLHTAARLLPVMAPVPELKPCPCICCSARAVLLATNRDESPWCDCHDFPPHQRCLCTPCVQQHTPVVAVEDA